MPSRLLATPLRVVLSAVAFAMMAVVAAFAWQSLQDAPEVVAFPLTAQVSVAAQVQLASVPRLRARGFTTLVDLRPDGESRDEPDSTEMAQAAREAGLVFRYVPVPPTGTAAPASVDALRDILVASSGPVLLYCRTARRAARAWSLVEAARPDGLSTDAILAAVSHTGQSADDLRGVIDEKVRARAAR